MVCAVGIPVSGRRSRARERGETVRQLPIAVRQRAITARQSGIAAPELGVAARPLGMAVRVVAVAVRQRRSAARELGVAGRELGLAVRHFPATGRRWRLTGRPAAGTGREVATAVTEAGADFAGGRGKAEPTPLKRRCAVAPLRRCAVAPLRRCAYSLPVGNSHPYLSRSIKRGVLGKASHFQNKYFPKIPCAWGASHLQAAFRPEWPVRIQPRASLCQQAPPWV